MFKELLNLAEMPSQLTNKTFHKIVFINSPVFVRGVFKDRTLN
jgi:hypothetical protein